jgi:hypothetical protein
VPRGQTLLVGSGILLLASGLVHVVVWLLAGAPSLEGPVTWRKPIEFGISGGITTLSLAWVVGRMPTPTSRWRDLLPAVLVAFFIPETALIDLQQWRGVPSHFNTATDFDGIVFSLMGVFILVVVVGIVIYAVRAFRGLHASPSTALAIRTGMLFLLLGQVGGFLILGNEPSTTSLANASVVGAAGQLKVPHALALHGLQVTGILAVLLERASLTESARVLAVAACAAGYALVLVAQSLLTFAGVGPLAFTPPALVLAALGALLVAGSYLRGLVSFAGPARA